MRDGMMDGPMTGMGSIMSSMGLVWLLVIALLILGIVALVRRRR